MKKKLLYLFVLLFIKFSSIQAQGTAGKEFWVAFMAQDWGCYYNQFWNNQDTAELYLSSQYSTSVTITAPGQNFTKTVTLVPNITKLVSLPREVVCRYSDSVTMNGVHVEADTIINVYAVNRYWYSKGATVVLPVSSIVNSPEYFITTNEDTYNWGWWCNGKQIRSPEFTIVGIADSSVIEIVPTGASSRNTLAMTPFQITLKKGQTFQYMTTDNDLTGSVIRSKFPMSKYSVFAGNRQTFTNRTINGATCYSSWDHDYEQMMPTVNWGREYTALPFKNNVKGYNLKVVAAENNTFIYLNGSYFQKLDQGEFLTHFVLTDTVTRVTANNRISVAQFALGGYSCQNHPTKPWIGDPAQVQLFPDEQFGTSATVNTVSQVPWWWWNNNWWWWQQNAPEHYINVMTRTQDTAFFTWNNQKLKDSAWKSSANLGGYLYSQIRIDTGSHYIQSPKGFLSYVYGYGVYDGYAYAAAANFKPIQNNFLIVNAQCVKDTIFFKAIENDSFANYQWDFGDGTGDTGTNVQHKYADTGWYNVKMWCENVNTYYTDTVSKTIYVADTKLKKLFGPDTAFCGKVEMVLISQGFNVDNEFSWQDRHFVYYRAVKAPGVYWLDVKERNGCVIRDSFVVSASSIPVASFDVSEESFCLKNNKEIIFTNHSNFKDSISRYIWDFGDTIIYTTDTNTIVRRKFKKANTYPVLMRAETYLGCYHDTFKIVDVLPSPLVNFTFTKKDTCFNTNGIVLKNNTITDPNEHRRFRWNFSEGFNISNSNPGPRSYTAPGKYKVTLFYENKNGCMDTMIQDVTIVSNPVANFSIPNFIYCSRDTIPFDAAPSTSVHTPLKYKWYFDDNTTDTFKVARKSFLSTDTNRVKLVITTPQGCRDSFSKKIFVNEKPLVDFTINKDTQCFVGHRFDFVNSTKFTGGSLNYSWILSDGSSSTDSNLLDVKFIKDSIYEVKLSTTSTVGCYSEKIKTVYLGTYPLADFSVVNDKQCLLGNSFSFADQSNISKGSVRNYIWSFDNNDTSHSKNINNYKFSYDDTFKIQLISISNLGCRDTVKRNVIVFPQPVSKFNVNDSDQCVNNQKFVLSNQSTLKYGNLSYNWNYGNNTSSNDTNSSVKYNSDNTYLIRMIAKSDQNCADTSFQTVIVQVNPVSQFDIDKDRQCFKGNLFNFSNKSNISKGNIISQKWLMDDANTYSTLDVFNYTYTTEDTFDVKLITVSDKNCSDTVTKRVVTFAQPNVSFVIPNDTQCWQKNKFAIQNGTTLKYGVLNNTWDFGDGTQSNKFSPNDKVYPNASASYVVKYKAVTEHGCSDSAQKDIALLERPVSAFDVNDTIQCFNGHSFDFVNNTSFSAMNTLSYWWDYKNGSNSTGFMPNNATYNQAGIYQVQLVSYSSLTNCFDTSYRQIVVAPHANVSFAINSDSQCFRNNLFAFNNQTQLQFGEMTYHWNFGDNTTSSDTSPSKSYAQEQSHQVKLMVTTNYDCIDSLNQEIAFFASPKASFAINDTAQCLNQQSFDFTNTSNLDRGTFISKWNMDDLSEYNTRNVVNKQFDSDDLHSIQLSILTDRGCTDTTTRSIYLENIKNFEVLLTDNDTQCLKGNAFDFSANKTNSKVDWVSSEWLFGDGQSSVNNDPSAHSYTLDSQYQVSLVTISGNGCRDTNSMTIYVYPHPVSAFSVAEVCFPEPSVFNNQSTIKKGSIDRNLWTIQNSVNYSQLNPTHSFSEAGEYDAQLITVSDKGCRDTLILNKVAWVKEKPKALFEFVVLPLTSAEETDLQFTNLSSTNATRFNWDFGNNTYSTDINPKGNYRDTGKYNVTLIASTDEGCADTFSMNTGSLIPDFVYYLPNAFSPNGDIHNNVYKGFGSLYAFKFKMEIYNRWGEKLWETEDIHQGWDGYYQGELCQQGAYVVRVQIIPFKGTLKSFEQSFLLLR
jgi:gliding motility-associated-like protein